MLLQEATALAAAGAESDTADEGVKQSLPTTTTTSSSIRLRRFVNAALNTKSLAKPAYIVTSTGADQQSRDNAQ